MKILVIGTGYVGLVTAACLADMGHHVVALDINKEKIAALQNGIIPLYEPGLQEIIARNKEQGRLNFTTSYEEGLTDATVAFIAVSTPSLPSGACDLSFVESATRALAKAMHSPLTIVSKSTVPVGTTEKIHEWVQEETNISCDVVSNPEFLKEGSAVSDSQHPDRILIGTSSPAAIEVMKELYAPLNLTPDQFLIMDPASSELAKYAANTMLAMRISFMNELSHLCEETGADIHKIKLAMGKDERIGPHFLNAGAGYGGSCFPKDVQALCQMSQERELPHSLASATHHANERQKHVLFHKLEKELGNLNNKKIGIWGLAFKPHTDDMREAPSLTLIRELLKSGAHVTAYDPLAIDNAKRELPEHPSLYFSTDPCETARAKDALVLVTEWPEFKQLPLSTLPPLMKTPLFLDGRNQFDPSVMQDMGFDYHGIGIPSSTHASVFP